jgi:hypothetical protein
MFDIMDSKVLAGAAVGLTVYYLSGSIQSAVIVVGVHAATHYLAEQKKQ